MKYQKNDFVEVIKMGSHEFKIGEELQILEVDRNTYCQPYRTISLDSREEWWVYENEIKPIQDKPKLITRSRDYSGCDPDIAEALKRDLDVYCEVWDNDDNKHIKRWIQNYQSKHSYPYKTDMQSWKHACPIARKKTETRVKKASEIMKYLEDSGYEIDCEGD